MLTMATAGNQSHAPFAFTRFGDDAFAPSCQLFFNDNGVVTIARARVHVGRASVEPKRELVL